MPELDDAEIEQIHELAHEAASQSWICNIPSNPYPDDPERAEIWDHAFRNAFANEWH